MEVGRVIFWGFNLFRPPPIQSGRLKGLGKAGGIFPYLPVGAINVSPPPIQSGKPSGVLREWKREGLEGWGVLGVWVFYYG